MRIVKAAKRGGASASGQVVRRAALTGMLLATVAAAPSFAQSINNPGFETGDTTGWTTNGGYWGSGAYPPNPSEYSGPANLATIMTAGSTDPYTGTPTVFAGNYALRLNDASGGNDITALQQTVTNYSGNKIYYAWNAVLEPSHGATDSPSFLIKVVDLTTNSIVTNIGYSAFTAQNTTIFRSAAQFVTTDWKVEDIDVTSGHDYQLLFLAVDCLYGGHAGYVYVDGFGNAIPLNNPDVTFDPATGLTKGALILIPIGGNPDIDLNGPYTVSQLLAGSVNPNFVGGVLQGDGSGPVNVALSVQSQGGTIDTNGSDLEISSDVTGTAGGSLTKTGLGKLTLSSMTTLDADFIVDNGVLDLPSTLSAMNVRVNGAGTLQGTGNVVANLIVGSGGRLAPGSGVGTLDVVGGNVSLGSGSTFALDIDGRAYSNAGGSGTYDRLVVTAGGFAAGGTIAPQLRGIAAPATNTFTPVLGDTFTVVTADSVTGQFASVAQPTGLAANTRFDVFYNPKNVQLVVTPASLRALGLGNGWKLNGVAAATGLDAVRPAAGTRAGALQSLFNQLYGFNAAGYQNALQQLSGENHVFAEQAALAEARSSVDGALDAAATYASPCDTADRTGDKKERACTDQRNHPALWTRLFHEEASYGDDATAEGFETTRHGFIAGLHALNSETTRIGFGGRYSESTLKSAIGYRSELKGYSLFGYASHALGPVTLSAYGGYSHDDVDARRSTDLTTGRSLSTASYGISSTDLALEARTSLPVGKNAVLKPVVGVSYSHVTADAVNEVNADPNLALKLPKETWDTTQGKLGADLEVGIGAVKADVTANWLHTLSGDPTARRGVSLGAASWQASSVGIKDDAFEFGAGLTATVAPGVKARLEYRGVRDTGNYKVDRGTIGLAVAF